MAESKEVAVDNLNSPNRSVVNEQNDPKEDNKTDQAMEPMLLEELKSDLQPGSLKTLQETLSDKKLSLNREDYLVLFIHIITMEVGFIPRHCTEYYNDDLCCFHKRRIINSLKELPKSWKITENSYLLRYLLPLCIDDECQLIIVKLGEDLVLNCKIINIETNYSILLDPSLYIMTSTTHLKNKFQNISQLSRLVKDNICIPAKNTILINNGYPGLYFNSLPLEVIMLILSFLRPIDLARVERTSKFLRNLANDPVLWSQIKRSCKLAEENFYDYKRSKNLDRRRSYFRPVSRCNYLL